MEPAVTRNRALFAWDGCRAPRGEIGPGRRRSEPWVRRTRETAFVLVVCLFVGAAVPFASATEVARTRDGERWLVSKAQSGEDWLITYDALRGTVSGSVATRDGVPVLIDCDIVGTTDELFDLSCFGTGDQGWTDLTRTTVMREFLAWPDDPVTVHPPPARTIVFEGLEWEVKGGGGGGLHDVDNLYVWAGRCVPFDGFCDGPLPSNCPLPQPCQPNQAAVDACEKGAAKPNFGGCGLCPEGKTCEIREDAITTIWDWLVHVNDEGGTGHGGHADWRIPGIRWPDVGISCCNSQRNDFSCCGTAELDALLPAECAGTPCVVRPFDEACARGCDASECSCTAAGEYGSSATNLSPVPTSLEVMAVSFDDVLRGLATVNPGTLVHVRAVRGP